MVGGWGSFFENEGPNGGGGGRQIGRMENVIFNGYFDEDRTVDGITKTLTDSNDNRVIDGGQLVDDVDGEAVGR